MKILRDAQAETVGDVEIRRSFLRMVIEGILRGAGGNGARRSGSGKNKAGIVNRLTPGITSLNSGSAMPYRTRERSLKRVIIGVRVREDRAFHAKSADHVPGAVKPGMRRKSRRCAGERIGK